MSLKALLSNSLTLAYYFLMLLRPASLLHFWAKLILRECVRLYAISISGYSSKSISARSFWLGVHFSGDTINRYLLRMSSSAFVSLFFSIYAQMSAHILRDYYPVLCMVCVCQNLSLPTSHFSLLCVGNKHLASISYCGFIVISRFLQERKTSRF